MAIFGAGSNWDGEELKSRFFAEGKFILGWNQTNANDLYLALASLKAGDVLYLKAGAPGSRNIRVKGIGIVIKPFMSCVISENLSLSTIRDWNSLFVRVEWIHRKEFTIEIPETEGRLTNIRAATIYEEHLPFVQEIVIKTIIGTMKPESE